MTPEELREWSVGLCECGCGKPTSIASRNRKSKGQIKGKPLRFISGHNKSRELNPNWKGKETSNRKTYNGTVPNGAEIHHHTPDQLVVCQDHYYHMLLHRRQRAYEACGHANWRKCVYCKQYDSHSNLYIYEKGNPVFHMECHLEYERLRRLKNKSKKPILLAAHATGEGRGDKEKE
jgi:hypothetical protein